MSKKIYRTIFRYEVLTDEPIEQLSLSDISYMCTEGHASGVFLTNEKTNEELTGKDAVKVIREQGTDPEFFMMDEDGKDIDGDIFYGVV